MDMIRHQAEFINTHSIFFCSDTEDGEENEIISDVVEQQKSIDRSLITMDHSMRFKPPASVFHTFKFKISGTFMPSCKFKNNFSTEAFLSNY